MEIAKSEVRMGSSTCKVARESEMLALVFFSDDLYAATSSAAFDAMGANRKETQKEPKPFANKKIYIIYAM